MYMCVCMYVCVYVCVSMSDHSTGRNFYLIIATKFGTQVGLVKRHVKFKKMGYVGPIGTTRGHH